MNITELHKKIKNFLQYFSTREIYTIFLIVAVGFGSFGLGRLSRLAEARKSIRIEEVFSSQTASAASAVNGQKLTVNGSRETEATQAEQGGKVVASKGGLRYHFPWCSGAQKISAENKLWFNSIEEAQKAGYTPASNCKGLR